MDAIDEMRRVTSEQCFISGMSATTADMKKIADSEVIIYMILAVIFTSIILILTTESILMPVFFMLSIGIAMVWNLGSNIFLGRSHSLLKRCAWFYSLELQWTTQYSCGTAIKSSRSGSPEIRREQWLMPFQELSFP